MNYVSYPLCCLPSTCGSTFRAAMASSSSFLLVSLFVTLRFLTLDIIWYYLQTTRVVVFLCHISHKTITKTTGHHSFCRFSVAKVHNQEFITMLTYALQLLIEYIYSYIKYRYKQFSELQKEIHKWETGTINQQQLK